MDTYTSHQSTTRELEVADLIDPLRMINEGIAVVLPIIEDHLIAVPLEVVDGVKVVPLAEDGLHPGLDIALAGALGITAGPLLPIRRGDVEVGAREVSLHLIVGLEARASVSRIVALPDEAARCGLVRDSLGIDVAKGQVAAKSVDVAVRGPELEEIRLAVGAVVEASEPALRPYVLSVETVSLLLVVAALAALRGDVRNPAVRAVDIGNVGRVLIARVAREIYIDIIERDPHLVVCEDSVGVDEVLKLSLEVVVRGGRIDVGVVVSGRSRQRPVKTCLWASLKSRHGGQGKACAHTYDY